jgi:transcriptional regulator with XRE-family HTH domain
MIGKYERDEVKPSIEVAAKIADALEVSLDYLVGKTSVEVDSKTLKRLQDIQNLMNKTAPPSLRWWMLFLEIEKRKNIMLSKTKATRSSGFVVY